jgi:DNA-binding LytR/AlgR family response regulator
MQINILIVEDNPQELQRNAEMVNAALEGTPIEVKTHLAASGEEALHILQGHTIDGALVDVRLPGMDGYAFVEKMREDDQTYRIPVVFVTAEDNDVPETYKRYNNIDYIKKPCARERYLAVVRKLFSMIERDRNVEQSKRERVLPLHNSKSERFLVPVNSILYAQMEGRKLRVVRKEREDVLAVILLRDFLQLAKGTPIVQCSKSCAVNIQNIQKIIRRSKKTHDIFFDEGGEESCPLSDNYYLTIRKLLEQRA